MKNALSFLSYLVVGLLLFSASSKACDYANGCEGNPPAGCRFAEYYSGANTTDLCLPDAQYEIECFDADLIDAESGHDGWFNAGRCYIYYGDKLVPDVPKEAPREPTNTCGSIINIDNLSVGEVVQLQGINNSLHYTSDRVLGRLQPYSFSLPLIDSSFTEIPGIVVTAEWLGQTSTTTYLPANITTATEFSFTWDGKDSNGDYVEGPINVKVTSVHTYLSGLSIPHGYDIKMGVRNVKLVGLGGWTLPMHHFYSATSLRLYTGSGGVSTPDGLIVNKIGNEYESVGGTYDSETTSFQYYLIPNRELSLAYIFTKEGRHLETRSTVTGALFYTFNYDVSGRLEQVVDSFGNITQITRPNATTVVITAPSLKATTIILNADGWAQSITDPLSNVHSMTYTTDGLMTTFTNPNAKVSTFTYNADGELTKDENNLGFSLALDVISTLNQRANTIKEIRTTTAEGIVTDYISTTKYDSSVDVETITPSGNLITREDSNLSSGTRGTDGYYEGVSYTVDGRLSPSTNARVYGVSIQTGGSEYNIGIDTVQTYDDLNVLKLDDETITTSFDGNDSVQVYDGITKTYTTTSSMGKISKRQINDFEQVVKTKYASLLDKDYTYDTSGRLTKIQQGSRVTEINYNAEFEVSSVKNAAGKTMTFTYDDNGRVTGINNNIVEFQYDGNGNIVGVKPPGRSFYDLIHNGLDALKEFIFPSVNGATRKKIVYDYDNDRRIEKITRPNGDVIDYVYHATKGRLERVETTEGDYVRKYYDSTDQLKWVNAPNGVKIWLGYKDDILRNVNTNVAGIKANNFKWYTKLKLGGQTLKMKPSNVFSKITYQYDNDELLKKAGDLVIDRYANTGFIEKIKLNGTYEFQGQSSSFGETSRRSLYTNGSLHFKEIYIRDDLGRISKRTETLFGSATPNVYDYYYDYIGKLKQVDLNGVELRKYLYDLNGNRTGIEENAIQVVTGTYDNEDRILTYGTNTYVHDDFGQIISKTDSAISTTTTTTYAHNSLGALTSVVIDDGTTTTNLTYTNDGVKYNRDISSCLIVGGGGPVRIS